MKISIIVPVYNAEHFVEKLINSVLEQTYKDYELILVDDGSKDNSYEIIKKYADENDKIFAYKKQNEGPGLTRKYGYEKSTGGLLFFVDSDDWITDKNVLETINDIFDKNKIDVLFFDREEMLEDEMIDLIKGFELLSPGIHSIDEINEVIRPGLGSKILKKELLNNEMFIDSKIYEDLYTTYLYLKKCDNFYYIDKTLYTIYHDKDSNSLSSMRNTDKLEKSADILLYLYKSIDNSALKYSLALRMPDTIIPYYKDKIRRKSYTKKIELKNKMREIGEILNNNNIKLNKMKYRKINVIFYNIIMMYLNRKVKIKKG